MLTEIYIEAFDEELADQVWVAWDAGEINRWCSVHSLVAYRCRPLHPQ